MKNVINKFELNGQDVLFDSIYTNNEINFNIDGYIEKIFSVNGKEHSSMIDQLDIRLKKGTKLIIGTKDVNSNTPPGVVACYFYKNNKSVQVRNINFITEEAAVTLTSDIDAIGIYKALTGPVGMISFYIKNQESISYISNELSKKTDNLYKGYKQSLTLNGANSRDNNNGNHRSFKFNDLIPYFETEVIFNGNITDASLDTQSIFGEILSQDVNNNITFRLAFDRNMYNDLMDEHRWILPASYNISKLSINFRYFSDETATFTVIQYPNLMDKNYFNKFENNILKSLDYIQTSFSVYNNSEHSSHNDQLYIKPTSNNLHINIKTDSPESILCVVYLYYSDNTSNVLRNISISNKEEIYIKLSLTPELLEYEKIGLYVYNNKLNNINVRYSLYNDAYDNKFKIITNEYNYELIADDFTLVSKKIIDKIKQGTKIVLTVTPETQLTAPEEGEGRLYLMLEVLAGSSITNVPIERLYYPEYSTINTPVIIEHTVLFDYNNIYVYIRGKKGEKVSINLKVLEDNDNKIKLTSNDFEKGTIYGGVQTSALNVIRTSIYIPCISLDVLKLEVDDDNVYFRYVFYDKDKKFIGDFDHNNWYRTLSIIVPENSFFVKICCLKKINNEEVSLEPYDVNDMNLRISYDKVGDMIKRELLDITDIKYYNPTYQDKILALTSLPGRYAKNKNMLLPAFAITTDIHTDWPRMKRVYDFVEHTDGILGTFNLGDYSDHPSGFRTYDFKSLNLSYNKPFMNVTGNHEYWYNKGLLEDELINKLWTAEQQEHNGTIHPIGKNYWHKDIKTVIDDVTHTLRIIGPYEQECPVQPNSEGDYPTNWAKATVYWTQEQIDWFINLLDTCDENTHIMILMHYPPCKLEYTEHKWNDALTNKEITNASYTSASDPLFLIKIIDAWINGTNVTYNMKFAPSFDTNFVSNISVNHTFITSHKNRFAGFICGHSHIDYEAYPSGYEDIKCVGITCTTSNESLNLNDTPRLTTGKTQDAVTVISYDYFNNNVRLVKFGATETTRMFEKTSTIMNQD